MPCWWQFGIHSGSISTVRWLTPPMNCWRTMTSGYNCHFPQRNEWGGGKQYGREPPSKTPTCLAVSGSSPWSLSHLFLSSCLSLSLLSFLSLPFFASQCLYYLVSLFLWHSFPWNLHSNKHIRLNIGLCRKRRAVVLPACPLA